MDFWDRTIYVRAHFVTVCIKSVVDVLELKYVSVSEKKNSSWVLYRYAEYQLWYDSNKHIKLWATGIIDMLCVQRLCISLGFVPDNCKDVNYYAIIHQLKDLAALLLSQIPKPLLGH